METKPTQDLDEQDKDDADTGAPEGSSSADQLPAMPADDDAPLGDTDQHSDA